MRQGLIVSLLFIGLISSAQAETLTLKQAVTMGMEKNYDLQIAYLEVERASAGITSEEGRFDVIAELGINATSTETPAASTVIETELLKVKETSAEAALSKQFQTGLEARLSLSGQRSDADTLAQRLDPAYRTALVLDLSQPLLKDRGSVINRSGLEIAETRHKQASFGYLDRAQQLTEEIELTYFDLAEAESGYELNTLSRDLAATLLDGNRRKFEAGLMPITEVYEAETAMVGREESMLLASQKITLARNRLLELIEHGESALSQKWAAELPTITSSPTLKLTNALDNALQQRPDLQQARLELENRKVALVYAKNQELPQLDLEASLGINGLAGDDASGSSRYDGNWSDSLDSAKDADGTSWYAGLRFSLPLQNRVAQAQSRDAAARDKQALYRLRRAEIAAEAEIRSAHDTLRIGEQRLKVAQRAAELAQKTLEQENRRLEEGFSDTFRVLTFQNALVSARIREVAAQTDYHRAQVRLYRALGNNLERYDIIAALPRQGDHK